MVRYLNDEEKECYGVLAKARDKEYGKWLEGNMHTNGGYKCSICGW